MSVRRLRLCCCLALSATACLGSVAETPRPGSGSDPARPGVTGPAGGGGPAVSPPGSGGSGGAAATGMEGCGLAPARLWKLTPTQFGRAVASLLPGVRDAGDRVAASVVAGPGFSNDAGQLSLTGPHLNAVLEAAWQLAAEAAAAPDKLMPCLAQSPASPACLADTVATLGARAFRRDCPPRSASG